MSRFRSLLFCGLWMAGFHALCLVAIECLSMTMPMSGHHLVVRRFMTGYWTFLDRNLPLMSWNAATWVPGVSAFLIALGFIHVWLRRWSRIRERPWNLLSSLCLASIIPTLFVIAFLVPGILFLLGELREINLFDVRRPGEF